MPGPVAALLEGGNRLHLHHGPIDLIIGADGARPDARARAFAAAAGRFETILQGLVAELAQHRAPLTAGTPLPADAVGRRMHRAAVPFLGYGFLTPMIAVAGSVADEVLQAMLAAGPLERAYVNNGGDIAVHLAPDAEYRAAMALQDGSALGWIGFSGRHGIGGVATSGAGGRSMSFGIADSVTVLAGTAATADTAATLIANAVDLQDHPGIRRAPADTLQPDTDLGDRAVVTAVPALSDGECALALAAGQARAGDMISDGLIVAAALSLQGRCVMVGEAFGGAAFSKEIEHV